MTPEPRLAFGCEPLGGSDWGLVDLHAIVEAVEVAIGLGVTLFDTADVYGLGRSETRLRRILGDRISSVDVSTKGGVVWERSLKRGRADTRIDASPSSLKSAIEASRRRLGLDQIPIYFLHWPDPSTDVRVSMDYLMTARDIGWIRQIGCSNFGASELDLAASVADVSFLQTPLNILTGEPAPELIQALTRNNIRIMAYGVLAQGLLSGKYTKSSIFPPTDRRSRLSDFQGMQFEENLQRIDRIESAAQTAGLSLVEFAIRWTLELPYVESVIVGIKSPQQIREAVRALRRSERSA